MLEAHFNIEKVSIEITFPVEIPYNPISKVIINGITITGYKERERKKARENEPNMDVE